MSREEDAAAALGGTTWNGLRFTSAQQCKNIQKERIELPVIKP